MEVPSFSGNIHLLNIKTEARAEVRNHDSDIFFKADSFCHTRDNISIHLQACLEHENTQVVSFTRTSCGWQTAGTTLFHFQRRARQCAWQFFTGVNWLERKFVAKVQWIFLVKVQMGEQPTTIFQKANKN